VNGSPSVLSASYMFPQRRSTQMSSPRGFLLLSSWIFAPV
jgi:hypothetical protein